MEDQKTVVVKEKDLQAIVDCGEQVFKQLTDAVLRSVEWMAFEAAHTTRVCADCREEYLEDVLRDIANLIEQLDMADTHNDLRGVLNRAKQAQAATEPAPAASSAVA